MTKKDETLATGDGIEPKTTDDQNEENLPSDLGETGKELIKKFRTETKQAQREAAEVRAKLAEIEKAKTDEEKAAADALAKKAEEEKLNGLSDIERIEKQLQDERQQRINLEARLVERENKERFLTTLSTLGIRDEVAANDLYSLVRADLNQENIETIANNAKQTKQYFFNDKPSLGGHGGSAGTGGDKESHGLTAEQIAVANSMGMTLADYAKYNK